MGFNSAFKGLIRSSKKFLAINSLHTFLSSLLLPLIGQKCLLQYSGFTRPLSTFFCQCERPICKTRQNIRQIVTPHILVYILLKADGKKNDLKRTLASIRPFDVLLISSSRHFFLLRSFPDF